jgi:hypothetical protein
MPGPGGARGQPALEQTAQETVAAITGVQRRRYPPGYEPAPLSAEERAEAEKAEQDKAAVCILCAGYHALPSSPACPRLASVELNGDQKITKATYWPGRGWAKGRVVFREDAMEDEEAGDGDHG